MKTEQRRTGGIPDNRKSGATRSIALDDEQRLKVLSPAMLVTKRFIRNRLAMVGLIIIIGMFLFAFVGPFLSPYGEIETFFKQDMMYKDYASLTQNAELRIIDAPGESFPSIARGDLILAVQKGQAQFSYKGVDYSIVSEGADLYRVAGLKVLSTVMVKRGMYIYSTVEGEALSDAAKAAFEAAVGAGTSSFDSDGVTYSISQEAKGGYAIGLPADLAFATMNIMDLATRDTQVSYALRLAAEKALDEGNDISFEVEGHAYELIRDTQTGVSELYRLDGADKVILAAFTRTLLTPFSSSDFLPLLFMEATREACAANASEFTYVDDSGASQQYAIVRRDLQFDIKRQSVTTLIDTYAYPSWAHPLGTDGNGRDLLTRLMYGGRISLMIGFIVVFLEVALGVILGGVAGYFGGWIDNAIMRLVDVFNCIPSLPLIIILGGIMDALKLTAQVRILYMMVVLGLLGWPGIARMVRGQILSLREQEFMIATEATGLRVSRRIFRHLVPNVIPQLIVLATMGLGGVILTESVLSFLGLGVKFPFASWGNIMDAVSNVFVMTNYWFVWIPAGLLILLTVLGFNFIGDGLRDAFDPKMKR